MILILAIVYCFNTNTIAAPVSRVLSDVISPDYDSSPRCLCPNQQRSLWDILWSCLSTIFLCTWVSVHPNIPPSGETQWKAGLRRLELMLWALIAPELIIYWAMRQWYGARVMFEKFYGQKWTKAHAHFAQMGGFTLFDGGEPRRVLLPEEMEDLILDGRIDLPQITEEEIRDRSKGDGLAKGLVIGQTSWFVAQCIARRAQGLILTELELVTGAFAILNGLMYFLWWNKPLDVRCSVPVHLLDEAQPVEKRLKFKSTITRGPWDTIFSVIVQIYHLKPGKTTTPSITRFLEFKGINRQTLLAAPIVIVTSLWNAILAFFSRLDDIADYDNLNSDTLQIPGHVSTAATFYANINYSTNSTADLLVRSSTSIVASLFGGLHCAAWFFVFPSHAELIIWRVCSTVISIIPLGLLFTSIAAFWSKSNSISEKLWRILEYTFLPSLLFLPIYAIARLILLGEALVALRYLPPEAVTVVNWLSFLPHI